MRRTLATLTRRTMSSLSLQYEAHGQPRDVLRAVAAGDAPTAPPPGHVVVRWRLAPMNWSDVNTIEGTYPSAPSPPAVPGNEGVGVVTAAAPDVISTLPVGVRVVPIAPRAGTWGAWSLLPSASLYAVPPSVSDAAAATMAVNPPTAVGLLDEVVELARGDVVVQNGATTAVGKLVLQLCAARGLQSVNIIRDRADAADLARVKDDLTRLGGGPHAVRVLTESDATALAGDAARTGARLGLNCVGGKAASAVVKLLGPGGTIVTYGGLARKPVTLGAGALIFKDIRARGWWLSSPARADRRRRDMEVVSRLLADGVIGTEIDVVPLTEWKTALNRMEAGGARKQVLQLE